MLRQKKTTGQTKVQCMQMYVYICMHCAHMIVRPMLTIELQVETGVTSETPDNLRYCSDELRDSLDIVHK